ncbi:hypothetical protein [Sinosporangium siamense]|nr:hypothetical protein [Sinosporangium siamense]
MSLSMRHGLVLVLLAGMTATPAWAASGRSPREAPGEQDPRKAPSL